MDKQITGLAGELFVAAELSKRNLQVLITFGNAKSIDLMAIRQDGLEITYQVQVKTLRKAPNCFTLHTSKIHDAHIYVFVYLNAENQQPDFFILRGIDLKKDLSSYYGVSLGRTDRRETINHGPLQRHKNDWAIFEN